MGFSCEEEGHTRYTPGRTKTKHCQRCFMGESSAISKHTIEILLKISLTIVSKTKMFLVSVV